jgi:tetratricopeptide (TPR) repeat protein
MARPIAAVPGCLLALLLSGCGILGGGTGTDDVGATGPDPVVVAQYQAALQQLDDGDRSGGEAGLQALAESHPDLAGPLVNIALLRMRDGDTEAAEALLGQALEVCERCAPAWNTRGVLQRRQGRFDEAEASYLAAIAADPDYDNAYYNLGVLYELYLWRPVLALEQYARFLELHEAGPDAEAVDKWIVDLKRRAGVVESAARMEDPS